MQDFKRKKEDLRMKAMTSTNIKPEADEKDKLKPLVSIVVPCRNEFHYLDSFLEGILSQNYPSERLEILVADGMSDDGTRDRLTYWKKKLPLLEVIDNPDRIVSSGLNRAIRASVGQIIVRMDVHTDYAENYIDRCVKALGSTGADNVGGPWRAAGEGFMQKAISLAFQSAFSSGGAGSHQICYEGPVDSVYLGCWNRKSFERYGFFDEDLVRNQDDEHNLRITRAGGIVWQSPSIISYYHPRASIYNLFKQYLQYGYWKVRVFQKHQIPASWRHVVPGIFVGGVLLTGLMSMFSTLMSVLFILMVSSYLTVNFIASFLTCKHPKYFCHLIVMPAIFGAFHFGYGWGLLLGTWDFFIVRRNYGRFTRITRTS